MARKIRVAHVIAGLSTGGAEITLLKLLSRIEQTRYESQVISLTDIGPVGAEIRRAGILVRSLGMRRGRASVGGVLKLAQWFRDGQIDVVQTWMYHADLLGGIAGKLAGNIPVVWGIRHGYVDRDGTKRSTRWTAKVCAVTSHWLPAQIVCCSEFTRKAHASFGYAVQKMIVIPNGFDPDLFKPCEQARVGVRKEEGIPEDALLIGLIGRFDPQKDHSNFVEAAAAVRARVPDAHFLLCGEGVTWENQELRRLVEMAGIGGCCHLLGRRQDVARLMASLDILCSSSFSEGHPNVVSEAMACGVPCVVTDVGESAQIVGDTGKVVPPRNAEALAKGLCDLFEIGSDARQRLGSLARKRVEERFALAVSVSRYQELYQEMCRAGSE